MDVKTIAVIGANKRGCSIAHAAILGGYRTILEDSSCLAVEQGRRWIEEMLQRDVSSGRIRAEARDAALALLTFAYSAGDAAREGDLIIETGPEEMEMKIELFTIFDKFAKPGAIFASHTSSLSVSEMASVTVCPERCIGMRFSNCASEMSRLELVRGPQTSEETLAACSAVGRRLAKEVVVIAELHAGDASKQCLPRRTDLSS